MADVKWIKICTDIFDDEKILLIESMPDADSIIVIWFKLLCMAGKQNNGGVFLMNDKIAYTDEMLATIFRRNINTVRMALNTFEQFGMIERFNNTITIPNWEKHQSLEKITRAKELNRERVAKCREKQKLLCNGDVMITEHYSNATDKNKKENKKENKNNIYVQEFEELWKLYPRKEGKKDALRHYENARESGTTFEEVKKGIENYIQHIQETGIKQKYVKMGSSFFCEHLWENEYEVSTNDNMGTDDDEYGEWLDSLERE